MGQMKTVGKKAWGYRYVILVAVWLLYVINYFDRTSVLIFLPMIRDELGLTPAQAGFGASIFFFAYAIAQVSGGWLADRIGAKRVMTIAIVVFSAVTFLTGMVRSYVQFIWIRLFLGFGEGHHFAPAHKTIADWFPKKEKGTATAFFSTAWAFGPAIIPVVITALAAAFGSWRPVFYVLAVPGLLGMFILWYFVNDKPEEMVKKGRMTQEEYDYIKSGLVSDEAVEGKKGGMSIVVKDKYFWIYSLVLFCNLAIYWGSTTWISSFLYDQHHFNLKTMGALVSLPYVVAIVAMLLGGRLTDKIFKNKTKPVLLISYIVSIPVLFYVGMVPTGNVPIIITMLVLLGFFVNLSFGAVYAYPQIRYPKDIVGSAVGLSNGFGQLGSFVAPLVAGFLVVKTTSGYSYTGAFIFFAALAVLASIGTLFLKEDKFIMNNQSVKSSSTSL
ncbi:MFS transporter [Desulfosporosinus metallidurans]|uniref:Putative glucarate transporter n=1 Tax=Desulfosporosinus metallidurans TaxID=1888891 RepID=A0A1Q8QKR0_9FIRM|nr:MFS transporter [Desulfosporosinus metallidurans]OLN27882.1 putative glucarate transporter [Desulfosporosinus metallidurans]